MPRVLKIKKKYSCEEIQEINIMPLTKKGKFNCSMKWSDTYLKIKYI